MKLYCLKTVISVMCAVLPVLSFGKDWDCIVDGTMYSLDDENKTAQVKYVGGENVFIPDYITNSGIKYAVNSVSPGANVGLDIKTIVVDDKNEYLDSRNACNAVVDKQSNEIVLGCMNTVIPNSVVSIGPSAFSGCKNLMSISIPNSIVSIGERAFQNCKNLSSITIPSSVSFIGSNAFEGCENLKSFSIDSNPIVSADKSFRSLFGVDSPMVETVEIGESVISIGNNAFERFYKLKNITFPNSIVSIGSNSFCGTKLLEIELPQNLETIGEAAFLGSYLTSVTIPKSVHSIGKDAFGGYYGSMVANVVIEGDIDGLEICNVFGSSVEVCHLGEGVTKIDNRMFKDCSSLKSVSCSNTIDFIGSESFRGCSSLESFAIPMGVKSIGWGAFMDCYNLKEVSLPPSLQEVESVAFENCRRLEKVLVIDIDAWWHIDFKTYQSNPVTISHDLMLNGASVEHLVMPDDVDVVGLAQFKGLEKLKSVELNNHVSEISAMAFDGCSALETINFPSSLTKIWGWAFRDCHSLNVSVDLSDTNVELLGGGSFLRCTSITAVSLPSTLQYIYTEAFKDDTNIMSVYSYINEPLILPWDYTLRSLEPFACTEPDENQQDQDFMTIYQQAILYVPKGTAEAYRKSPVFKNFSNVQEMELSTRTIAVTKNRQTPFPIYDLTGRRIKKQYSNRVYIEDGFKIIK